MEQPVVWNYYHHHFLEFVVVVQLFLTVVVEVGSLNLEQKFL
jgi:hypothetical protein